MVFTVDQGMCIGCGICEGGCPDVFSIDDSGLATAIEDDVPAELEADARQAMDDCPVSAISEE
jgi:ferredoxin